MLTFDREAKAEALGAVEYQKNAFKGELVVNSLERLLGDKNAGIGDLVIRLHCLKRDGNTEAVARLAEPVAERAIEIFKEEIELLREEFLSGGERTQNAIRWAHKWTRYHVGWLVILEEDFDQEVLKILSGELYFAKELCCEY